MWYLYGKFTADQLSEVKKQIHSSLQWLLRYKDPKYSDQFEHVDVDKFLSTLLHRAGGLSSLFGNPPEYVMMMALLQEARNYLSSDDYDFLEFRRIILELHSIVDKLPEQR